MNLVALIGIGLIAVLGSWLMYRRRKRWLALGCGLCGYPAAGLERLTCPECGSDLTAVGILSAPPPRGELVRTILLWSLAVAVIGGVCTQLLYLSVPALLRQRSILTLGGTSGQIGQVTIDATGSIADNVARFERAKVSLGRGSGATPALDAELSTLIESSPWHGGGGGDAGAAQRSWESLHDWMSSAGVALDDPAAREDAMIVADRLLSSAFVGTAGNGSGSFSNGIRSSRWSGQRREVGRPVALGAWAVLWLAGCTVMLQQWRRCGREIAGPEVES